MPASFIIIDDDPISNLISRQIILEAFNPEVKVVTYTDPVKALQVLQHQPDDRTQVILLDLNMPQMTGWEFLEKFSALGEQVISRSSIYILSSSVDIRDHEKARTHELILGYIVKPLNIESVREIADKHFK